MMKIGYCFSMNALGVPKIGAEALSLFTGLGYDYAELPLAQIMDLSQAQFRGLLGQIAEGIPLETCNNFFPAQVRLTGNDANLDAALEYAKAALDRAAEMGAKIIVLGSSGAKNIPPGFPYERAQAQFKELLARLQDLLKPRAITVVLEPLNTKESNFVTTASEALNLVRELSLDNVKLLVDYYHLRMENEEPSVINKAGADLRHLHIGSKEGRLFPKPGDNENYNDFFSRLKAIGYNGRISVEAYSQNLNVDGAVSLELLRALSA